MFGRNRDEASVKKLVDVRSKEKSVESVVQAACGDGLNVRSFKNR